MRVLLCLSVVLIQFAAPFLFAAEESTPTPKAQAVAHIGKLLTADLATYAKEGDADFSALIEKHQLNTADWDVLAKDEAKEMVFLQNVILDILVMRGRSEHARTIIEKYDIQRNEPEKKQ